MRKNLDDFRIRYLARMFAVSMMLFFSVSPVRADGDLLARGKELYNGAGACASCHGESGDGYGVASASLKPKPRSFADGNFARDTDGDGKVGTEADIANVILNGAKKYGGSQNMPARPDLSEGDRNALAKYVLSLRK